MTLDLDRVQANVRQSTTEDLLDRATVYRGGMEPDALLLIEQELRQRGVSAEEQRLHGERRGEALLGPDGVALRCARCERPAVTRTWGWHRLWGLVPLFPRPMALCAEHAGAGNG